MQNKEIEMKRKRENKTFFLLSFGGRKVWEREMEESRNKTGLREFSKLFIGRDGSHW